MHFLTIFAFNNNDIINDNGAKTEHDNKDVNNNSIYKHGKKILHIIEEEKVVRVTFRLGVSDHGVANDREEMRHNGDRRPDLM